MHEIITLQLGQQANYLGTHYWNTQESYFSYDENAEPLVDHDRSFQQGIGVDGADTYTPRALIYDLKNAFGTLRRENALYDIERPENLLQHNAWGPATTIHLPAIPESEYQQALNAGTQPETLRPSTVRYWSDYNHVFYHPRSMIQLSEYEVNSSLLPFERFTTGEELFSALDKEQDILDRDLRPLLEQCDQLQAINTIACSTDAWGGFAAKYLERMSDELGKGSRWFFGLEHNTPTQSARQALGLVNVVQCLDALTSNVSLNFPMVSSFVSPALTRTQHPWQSSAVQAVALESLTLPTRLKQSVFGSSTASELEQVLNLDGRRSLIATGMDVGPRAAQIEPDSRMANGTAHEEELEVEPIAEIDMFPPSPSRRQPSNRPNRLYARVGISRQAGSEAEPGTQLNNKGTYLTSRIALAFPMLSSFPRVFLAATGDEVDIKTISSSSERVAWYVKDRATVARALLPAETREAIYDGLSSMAEEYEESMAFSDINGDDED